MSRRRRKSFSLKDSDTRGDELFESKKDAKASLDADALAINDLQDALFACKTGALLVVMQGIDTSGKDGTTKEAFRYTSPLGVNVFAFGKPTEEELAHDYLWRLHQRTPKKGYIHVFNRSQYEDVLVVKVRNLAPAKAGRAALRADQRVREAALRERHARAEADAQHLEGRAGRAPARTP